MKDGDCDALRLIFCSGTVALNRLVTNPTYPGIVDDYSKTFARAKDMKADILLAPHPEMYKMPEKRAKIADGAPNPFVNPGEFNAYAATLEKAFEERWPSKPPRRRKRRAEAASLKAMSSAAIAGTGHNAGRLLSCPRYRSDCSNEAARRSVGHASLRSADDSRGVETYPPSAPCVFTYSA